MAVRLSVLQKKFKQGGYVLVSPQSGRVAVHAMDIKSLYKKIDSEKIKDEGKTVVYIPSAKYTHVFRVSVSVRTD